MILDLRTLAIICNLVLFGSFFTTFAFWMTYRDRPGMGYWVLSLLMALIGFLLIALRTYVPDSLSILTANLTLTLSFLLIEAGIARFLAQRVRPVIFAATLVSVAAGVLFFTYFQPSVGLRIVLMSAMYIFLSVICLFRLKRDPLGASRNARITLNLLFIIYIVFMSARLIFTLLSPEIRSLDDFMAAGDFQAMAFIITLFFYSGLTFIFIWISYSSIETQRLTLLSAIEQAPTSIIITDSEGIIEYVNPAFTRKTGFSTKDSIGRNTRFLKNPDTDPVLYESMWNTIISGHPWHGEFENRKKNGEMYWDTASIAPVTDKKGLITHFVSVNEDITESKRLQDHLKNLANHDSLTGLPSRRLVMDRLSSALELAERNKQIVGVLFADLDRFKEVNDNLGHEAGDDILKIVADLLKSSLRKADTVARLGGDEFLVVLPQIGDRDGASVVAQGMIDAIAASDRVGDVGLSVGIALFPENGMNGKDLIREADNAMYSVKREGRNSWAFAEKSS